MTPIEYAWELCSAYWPGLPREDFDAYAGDDYALGQLEWADMVENGEGPMEERMTRFYERAFGWIFVLLRTCDELVNAWPDDRHRANIAQSYLASNAAGPQVILDYGGGVGSEAIYLAQVGHHICYQDVGEMARFAAWRFEREGLLAAGWHNGVRNPPIRLWKPNDARRRGYWDAIVALDVLEHLNDPAGVLADLAQSLRPGGLLIATRHSFKAHPTHNPATFWLQQKMDEVLDGLGLRRFAGPEGHYGIGGWRKTGAAPA